MSQAVQNRYYLWEASVRIFHWLLVVNVIGMVATVKTGNIEWHGRLGVVMIGLLVFRVVLGFIGGELTRFIAFLSAPRTVVQYFQGKWQGFGHNPVGGWSALMMLAMIAWMVLSGIFANDDIAFEGPWVKVVTKELSDAITSLHYGAEWFLYGLIGLHVAAIVFYSVVKKDHLLPPMISGWKTPNAHAPQVPSKPFRTSSPQSIVVAVVAALLSMVVAAKGASWLLYFGIHFYG